MAMRVRVVEGNIVALCAAEFPAEAGDLYIDDGQDHAIRTKLARDFNSERNYGIPECNHPCCPVVERKGEDS